MLTLDFSDAYARDIVDESNDHFSVKFELIYTIGTYCRRVRTVNGIARFGFCLSRPAESFTTAVQSR
jgi:hypothetical protein